MYFTNYSEFSSLEPKGKGDPESYRLELPFDIKSLHPLDRDKYLVEAQEQGNEKTNNQTISRTPDAGNLFILKKDSSDDVIPTVLNPISQYAAAMSQDSAATIEYLDKSVANVMEFSSSGLTDFGLSRAFNTKISSPHSLMVTEDTYAGLALGFPELEFSSNEVYVWQRQEGLSIGEYTHLSFS